MTMLTSLFWVLRVAFLKDVGLTEVKENDSKEMLHDKNENNSRSTSTRILVKYVTNYSTRPNTNQF